VKNWGTGFCSFRLPLFPRWLFIASAVLFLHGCHPCPAQPLPPAFVPITNRFAAPFSLTLFWDASPSPQVTGYGVSWWTNGGSTNFFYCGNITNTVITNLARRVVWYFAAQAFDLSSNASQLSNVVFWPPPPLTNLVVTVQASTASADSLAGPWQTNTAILICLTNPPGSHFWRQAGLSITSTNF